jgi:aspartate aminotransferase
LEVKTYSYYDKKTVGLDFEGMKKDLKEMEKGSIVLLHACAHNPTGIDPTREQWKEISDIIKVNSFTFFFPRYLSRIVLLLTDVFSASSYVACRRRTISLSSITLTSVSLLGKRKHKKLFLFFLVLIVLELILDSVII